MINYGKQTIDQSDIDAVVRVLKSELITQGPVTGIFESEVKKYTTALHAVACSSGTAALHIACLSLGLGTGDTAWTVPNTFVATANCILYCGARVDFVDIDANTFNISLPELSKKLLEAEAQGCLPKVLIVVHFAGATCDMQAIAKLAKKYNFSVIEDAAHALGAEYQQLKVGGCQFSDIATFSFHAVKSITTGEGGMLTTNSPVIAEKARLFANHGVTRDREKMTTDLQGSWVYEQICLGFNYRMSDLQAALGVSQLQKLDGFISQRERIVDRYQTELVDMGLKYQKLQEGSKSARHLFVVLLPNELIRQKAKFFRALEEQGIKLNSHYIPLPAQPYYRNLGFNHQDYPKAFSYYSKAVILPVYPELRESEVERIISALVGQIAGWRD